MGGGEAGGVMKTRYKVILISLGAVVLAGCVWIGLVVWAITGIDFGSSVVSDSIVHFQDPAECVYISSRCWGLLGQHEQIILSTLPIRYTEDTAARGEQYVMWDDELYYRKMGRDTLAILVWGWQDIPKTLPNGIHVVQKFRGGKGVDGCESSYLECGWSRVSYRDKLDVVEAPVVDTSCVNADSIQIVQAGPHDRTLWTVVIRKTPFERPCPECWRYFETVVSCETYDTLVDILEDFAEERSLTDTLEYGSFDFVATSKGEMVAGYMTGKEDSKRLLDRPIEAVKRMDNEEDLAGLLEGNRREINKVWP